MRLPFSILLACFLFSPNRILADAPYDQVQDNPTWSNQNLDDVRADKYFHESTFAEHYDGRFGDRKLNYDERRYHLTALMQTYISTMNDIGAETWIMHGSLLGWYWSRKILPWDSDIDAMVSEQSIHHLAAYHNMTVHTFDLHNDDAEDNGHRSYLLEVNPHYANGSLDEVNKIDARWIDTTTGLFIDITTLRRNATAEARGIDGPMMVKDRHHYNYDDIFPLRHTTFEGYPVKVPFMYADILIEEYGEKALSDVYFENHIFDAELREWRPLSCKDRGTCGYFRNPVNGINLPASLDHSVGGSKTNAPHQIAGVPSALHNLPHVGESLRPPRLSQQRPSRWA
ncbi:mannosyltransferase [Elasticomyces elasticus]|nr:mannosyltransferase [Elasticomyces elasticus]